MISLLAPTRGRPAALQEMVDSARQTANDPDGFEALAYVDDDDPADYSQVSGVRIVEGPRITLSECWNRLAAESTGDILHMSSDDIRFRSPYWDAIVEDFFAKFPDRIAFVYGRDGLADGKLGTHGFVHRRWFDTLGHFTWGGFPCDYADKWIHDVAAGVGRAYYIEQMFIEHMHPLAGKSQWDETHRERLIRGTQADVKTMYESLEDERTRDIEKLQAALA